MSWCRARPFRSARSRRFASRAARAGAALALAGAFVWLPSPASAEEQVAFTIRDERITESSGLAVSRRHKGVVYTHNDSGDVPSVFALGPDGGVRAVLTLGGANARDWEDIAVGQDERGRPAIFVGDIGDNLGGAWPYVTVYRIPEPARLRSQTIRATAFKIKYADGPRNAETLMINPKTNRLYLASKLFGGKVYEAPARLRTGGFNVVREVSGAPPIATGGAFSPDGRTCVIRTYLGARLYSVNPDGSPGKSLTSIGLPAQKQGESVTYTADGTALLVGSEGTNQPVYRIPLPEEALPSKAPSQAPSPENAGTSGGAGEEGKDASSTRTGLFLALAIAAAVGYGLLRKRG
ncbi:hypothetical protein [Actinomadura livida]|uniref:WD40 repeat domain-containing protein n=1 Tax=Actinomadura livida TaxID=79909 RepID=A0A7W7MWM9_9ACTN|nr:MULTISPECIES: hypothetical protein [Actinomadura]MBB4772999.1 hypothetical protein [Actinomadura catellatispora]GGU17376.1 hypothetical protein GCM10010208_47800 [Actinomadura livida]